MVGSEGTWHDELERAVGDGEVDLDANWVHPDDRADRAWDAAQRLLERIGLLEAAGATVAKTVKEMDQATAALNWQRYYWVGGLLRDNAQHWICPLRIGVRADVTGRLVVIQEAEPGKLEAREIGNLVEGRAMLTLAPDHPQVEGRPVFLVLVP